MKPKQNIKLLPVLELQPANFSKVERTSPQKSKAEAPQEWQAYHQACYKDSKLTNIKPIRPLSWLFNIETLPDDALKIILKNLIDTAAEDFESIKDILADPIEYAPLFPGGYLFIVNEHIKSEPGCCCGLEDISEWKEANTVLTGHGDDDFVHINRTATQVDLTINKEIFSLPKEAYNKIIQDAETQIDAFIERCGKQINDLLGIESGKAFARAMIYKWEGR